jgi:hypothetical protein
MECMWQENQNPSISACRSCLMNCNFRNIGLLYFGFSVLKIRHMRLKHVDSDYTLNSHLIALTQSREQIHI